METVTTIEGKRTSFETVFYDAFLACAATVCLWLVSTLIVKACGL